MLFLHNPITDLCLPCTTDLLWCCLQLFSGAATTTSRPVAARPTTFQPMAPAPPRSYQPPRQQYQQPYQQQYQQQPQRPQPPPSASTVQFNAPGGAMQHPTQCTAMLSAPSHADMSPAGDRSHRPDDHQQLPGSAAAHRLRPGPGVCAGHCEGRGRRGGEGGGAGQMCCEGWAGQLAAAMPCQCSMSRVSSLQCHGVPCSGMLPGMPGVRQVAGPEQRVCGPEGPVPLACLLIRLCADPCGNTAQCCTCVTLRPLPLLRMTSACC